jgi:hypothetical protein
MTTLRLKKSIDRSHLRLGFILISMVLVCCTLSPTAMLLNEFLKEHHKVQEQGVTIAQMQKQIEALTATVQKVSHQLKVNKAVQQVVASNQ